jgi:hypothetical protein
MTYQRYAFRDPGVRLDNVKIPYSSGEAVIPVFDYPITPRENFVRAMKRDKPLWAPNTLNEMQSIGAQDVVTERVRGRLIHTDFRNKVEGEETFIDWFGSSWTWERTAGGPMLTPGTKVLDNIVDWEQNIVWPDLSERDFEDTAARFMKDEFMPEKALNIDLGRGVTERMISLVGGYTEGMLSFATEPEAVKAFNDRFAEHVIGLVDKLCALYPVNVFTYHDDWGTERDTFFSEKMMEDLVFEPTKRIIDHIHSKDVSFILHTCGNITRFVPYTIAFHADMLQIQRRAVDIAAVKRKYGNAIGINSGLEGLEFGMEASDEQIRDFVRSTVDLYAPTGGYLASMMFMGDQERLWHSLSELYAYSREFYDNEQGRS